MKLIRKFKKTSKACRIHSVNRVFTVSIVAVLIMCAYALNLSTTTAFAAKNTNSGQPVVKFNSKVVQTKLAVSNTAPQKNAHYRYKIISYKDSVNKMKHSLISEVHSYISKNAKKNKMSATYIVNKCIDKRFDISLLLSQAHLESQFGDNMKGNSCFGMKGRGFINTNHAVDEYIKLMQTKYIISRTPEQLIAANFNVEGSSKYRYAGPGYGNKIKSIRKNIIKTTRIHQLFYSIQNMNTQIAMLENKYLNNGYTVIT